MVEKGILVREEWMKIEYKNEDKMDKKNRDEKGVYLVGKSNKMREKYP